MMFDMAKQIERERFAGWVDSNDMARVRVFAVAETEGNVSQMIRKLVREALAARETRTQALPESRQQ